MPNRRDYESFDTETQRTRTFFSKNKRPLIIVGGSTLLLAGVVLAVALPASTKSANGDVVAVESVVQSGGALSKGSSPSSANRPVTHKEFLKALCDTKRDGDFPWGYWDDDDENDDDYIDEYEDDSGSAEVPENFDSPESSEENDDDSGSSGYPKYKWWKNRFIPKRQRLWLEFLSSEGLLDKSHKHIPHDKFLQMWTEFLKKRNIDKPDTEDSDQPNPFLPEFKKTWLDYLNKAGLLDTNQENIAHDGFVQKWDDFLEQNRPASQTLPEAVTDQSSPDQFIQWWFNQLNGNQLEAVSRPFNSQTKSTSISHDQFTAWWKQYLQSHSNADAKDDTQNVQEDFFNFWLKDIYEQFRDLGKNEAYRKRIPHDQYLDMLCDSLLTGTYDPDYPNQNNNENNDNSEYQRGNNRQNLKLRRQPKNRRTDQNSVGRAHRVLRSVPLIDGHNDLAYIYRNRIQNHINNINLNANVSAVWGPSQTDIPRMRKGMMGGQFWSAYTPCTAQYTDSVRVTLDQIDTYSGDFMFVTKSWEIWESFHRGKIASMIGVEGGHSIDNSLATLRMFYDLGVRYLTLTHSCNTPWADASTADSNVQPGQGDHNGLTEWGKKLVREMNRLGMLIDLSHVSYNTMNDALNTTVAPVIFSHSSAWELCNHARNVKDDVLKKVALNGGIVMVNFYNEYVNCDPNKMPKATLSQVADHIEHIRDVAGINSVGIGSDFDGAGINDFPDGLSDVSFYPQLFAELSRRGWSDEDMKKVAGLNLIRVFKTAEIISRRLRDNKSNKAADDLISKRSVPDQSCRPDF